MNVPTPLNDTARDDRFDRGLDQLLEASPAGLDEIEPELRDITLQMVRLANNAGWIGTDPGESPARRRVTLQLITNAVAAVAVIGVVFTLGWFGIQYLRDQSGQYGSRMEPTVPADAKPASCDRLPRTDTEIAAIVRQSEEQVVPFQATDAPEGFPYVESLQLARDWNACLTQQNWHRATGYESEYFIWMLGQALFPNGTSAMTDTQIANAIIEFHPFLVPIEMPDGVELSMWATQGYVSAPTGRDNQVVIIGLDAWVAWMEDGDWVEYWPIVMKIEWDGTQWVIVSTSQEAIPQTPYKPDNAKPDPLPGE